MYIFYRGGFVNSFFEMKIRNKLDKYGLKNASIFKNFLLLKLKKKENN